MKSETELLKIKFEREKAARLEAEKLLEVKSLELYQSNSELKESNLKLELLISERTQKLSEAEKEYEFLVESINDMIFRLDLKGNIIFVNQVVTKILGLTKIGLIGKNILELLPGKHSKKIKAHFIRQFILKNCISSYEFPFKNRFNELIWIGLNVHFSSERCKMCPQRQETFLNTIHSLKAKNICTFKEIIVVAHDITSQKQAQINLEKSEKRYRELLEFLPEMICEVNSNGVLTYANQYAINKFGYTTDEVLNNKFEIINIFPPHLRTQIKDDIQNIYKNGLTFSQEYPALKKNGETFPVLIFISAIHEFGIVVGVRGVMIDITDRKRNEDEIARNLKQQELVSKISLGFNAFEEFEKKIGETLRIIGEHLNVSRVYIFEDSPDRETTSNTYEWCNEGIIDQIEELQNIPYILIPSWKNRLEQDNLIFSENIAELEKDIYEILEPQHIKSIIIYPLVISHERFGFIGFDECETNRKWKQTEIELLKTISNIISNAFQRNRIQTELINSERENRIIINSIPDVILQIDSDGNIKSFKSSQRFNLFSKLENDTCDSIHTAFNEKLAKTFQQGIGTCLLNGTYQFEFQHLVLNSIEFYESRFVKLNENEVLTIIRNVTELRENEKQLRIAKNKAEEASKAKSEFLANVSHEIRTPLNAILGFSQYLFDNITDKQHKEYISTILSSGKNLLNLINDILDLSKIESGKMDIEFHPMNYHEIINDIKLVFKQKIEQKGLSFKISTDASVPDYIYMDELRFYQIIFNLVSNAIKFTSKGFIHISAFAIKTSNVNEINLSIVIEDTGIGIKEDQQEIIFDSFKQQSGQSNRDYEGTGLGLAIVSGLLKNLNGTVSLKSKPGKGSVFTLAFNQVKVDYSEHEIAEILDERTDAELDPCTIMIVDDIEYNILVLKKLINSENVTFIEAQSGTEAFAKLSIEKPDIIFMDIRLPGMSGFDITEIIRKNEKLKNIPVIAFTASMVRHKNDNIDKVFDGFLQKPVFKKDIDNILHKFLSFSYGKTSKQVNIHEKEIFEISQVNEKMLPAVINELEKIHLKNWENIKDNLIIYEIEDFMNKLSEMAFQNSCRIITQYCNELNVGLQTFDIELIEKKLHDFPDIITKMKSLAS